MRALTTFRFRLKTRRSVSVNWVACGTCDTKIEGTELGGMKALKLDFPRSNVEIKNRKK